MVRVSSPAKLRPWSELTAKMVMGVVPGLVNAKPRKSLAISAKFSRVRDGYRVHAKGVVLCERACFCLLSAF